MLRITRNLGYVYLALEILMFLVFVSLFGFLTTILLFILTTVLGAAVLRQHSLEVMQTLQQWSQSGRPNVDPTWGSPFMILGGIFLIMPGFITDLLGIGFMILAWVRPKAMPFESSSQHGKTIDGEFSSDDATNDDPTLPKNDKDDK